MKLKLGLIAGIAAGCVLTVGLLLWFGLQDIGHALAVAGWTGLFAVTAVHIPSMALCGLAWYQVTPQAPPRSNLRFVEARWVRDGAGALIAVLPISGELMALRILGLMGLGTGAATASIVVDLTAELISQFLYTVTGVGLLSLHETQSPVMWWAAAGLLLSVPLLAGLVVVQRFGFMPMVDWLSARLADSMHLQVKRAAHSLQAGIEAIYHRPRRVIMGVLMHFAAWIIGAAETWVGAALLGHPLLAWEVLVVESLVYALRTAVFFIPSGLGVQEGGYVVVGALFGLDPQSALALSILKRGRDLILAAPALLWWQAVESRRFLASRVRTHREP